MVKQDYLFLNLNRQSSKCRAGVRHTGVKELLHYPALGGRQALVQVAHAVGKGLFQSSVVYLRQERSEVFLGAMQEPTERQRVYYSCNSNIIRQDFIVVTDL